MTKIKDTFHRITVETIYTDKEAFPALYKLTAFGETRIEEQYIKNVDDLLAVVENLIPIREIK